MRNRADIDSVILATLVQGPLHGYEIAKYIRESTDNLLKIGESALYPALHRLESEGSVVSEWEIQDGKTPKKTYTLTEKGEKRLKRSRKEWEDFVVGVSKLMSVPSPLTFKSSTVGNV